MNQDYVTAFILAVVVGVLTYRSGTKRLGAAAAAGLLCFVVLALGAAHLERTRSVEIEQVASTKAEKAESTGIADADASDTEQAEVEQLMTQLRSDPMVGLAVSEEPATEQAARVLFTAVVQKKSSSEISEAGARYREHLANWRSTKLTPALQRASDNLVIAITTKQKELIDYVQATDIQKCKAAALGGNLLDLDSRARELAHEVIEALRLAYTDGISKTLPQPVMTEEEAESEVEAMGITASETEVLLNPNDHTAAEVCSVTGKLLAAQLALSETKRAPFMRRQLSQ